MLKKTMLGIIAAGLLIGAENLVAKEKAGKPKVKQKQQLKAQQKQKGRAQQVQQKQFVGLKAQAKQPQKQKKAAKKAGRRRVRRGQAGHGYQHPRPQMLNKWFNALTKSYRQNDREKMGRILRKMNKARQNLKKRRAVRSSPRRKLRNRPRAGRRSMWLQRGLGRPNQGFKANMFSGWQRRINRGRRDCWFGQRRWMRPRRGLGW